MKRTKRVRQVWAWVLIAAFMFVFVGQNFHATFGHKDAEQTEQGCCHHKGVAANGDLPVYKEICHICDFTFFNAEASAYCLYTFVSGYNETKLLDFDALLIYRPIFAINAHSPPLFS
ncbi:hypothetical protein [Alloprevotella sp. OH1205_COT-284]|uniref:hypothetical protein n=1 Tax=Alloprevotella sp. OH1205_COT-284 TaxID=2491043 RepID=UPI000F5E7BA2|nr:hypothetical protein [Alloprevotella sp. OH1205_COT-284]